MSERVITAIKQVPEKRCELYRKYGLNRNQGSKLCYLLGYGSHEPLSSSQIEDFEILVSKYKKWKLKRISIDKFVASYQHSKTQENKNGII